MANASRFAVQMTVPDCIRQAAGHDGRIEYNGTRECCAPVLRTAHCPAKLAGPSAVRSTQFGAGKPGRAMPDLNHMMESTSGHRYPA
jgi:hypothetical protein